MRRRCGVPWPGSAGGEARAEAVRSNPVLERSLLDLELERAGRLDSLAEVLSEPVQRFFAFRRCGAERIADDARLGELAVIHRGREVLVGLKLCVCCAFGLPEAPAVPAGRTGAS